MRVLRLALLMLLALMLTLAHAHQASAQIGIDGYPPERSRPFKGAINCVQVVNSDGNFACSPLVTINPTTGAFSALGTSTVTSPVFGALVIAPAGNTLQALGNDLVIAKASTSTAPAGPGVGAMTLRVRPSPLVPGYCRLVIVAGNSFQEWPIAILAGNYPAFGVIGGVVNNGSLFSDYFTVDIPGGNAGC